MTDSHLSTLTDQQIRDLSWYYQIELRPGVITGGGLRGTLSLVRSQLDAMEIAGHSTLDIGTQEAVIPTLLALRGARESVCYDRLDLSGRIALVKEAYGVEFDYIHSHQLHALPAALTQRGHGAFDIVVFAGVLYHMIDPLGGLGLVRGLVRQNGLLLIETSAIFSPELLMHFNGKGRYYEGSNYFQITTGTLDYFLRMLRLQVLDCRYIAAAPQIGVGRVSVVCRAIDEALPEGDDPWMLKPWITNDMRAVSLNYRDLQSEEPEVGFEVQTKGLIAHHDIDSVDLTRSISSTQPFHPENTTSGLLLSARESSKQGV